MQYLKELMIGISTKVNLQGLNQGMAGINAKLNNVKMGFQGLNNKISGLEVAGLSLGMAGIIDKAVKFEDHMAGVIKQVNGMRDSSGNLTAEYKGMENQIRDLAKRSPISANEIADIVTAGARMNVAKEDLMGFTETAMKMATAFEAPAAELTDQMGKISNVFGIPIKSIGGLADTINYLDDNAISKGSDIINVLQRIGGTAKTVGMSAKDAAALGSTFLSLGASAEIAATGSNALMSILATAGTNKSATKGLSALGLNAKAIQQGMVTDATGTIQQVLNKVNALPQVQKLNVLTEIFGREYADDIAKVAGSVGEYRKQLELANSTAANGSMQREYENKLKTTSAQMFMLKNKAIDLSIVLGKALIPPMVALMDKIGPIVNSFGDWAKEHDSLIVGIGGLIAGLVGFKLALSGVGLLFLPFSAAIGIFKGLATSIAFVRSGALSMNLAFLANPLTWIIGGIVIAVVGLGYGIYKLVENWDAVKASIIDVANTIYNVIGKAMQWVSDKWDSFKSALGMGVQTQTTQNIQQVTNPLAATNALRQQSSNINPIAMAQQAKNTVSNSSKNQTNNMTYTPTITINGVQDVKGVKDVMAEQNRMSRSYLMGGVAV